MHASPASRDEGLLELLLCCGVQFNFFCWVHRSLSGMHTSTTSRDHTASLFALTAVFFVFFISCFSWHSSSGTMRHWCLWLWCFSLYGALYKVLVSVSAVFASMTRYDTRFTSVGMTRFS